MLESSSAKRTARQSGMVRRPWTETEKFLLVSGTPEAITLLLRAGRSDAAIRIKKSEMGISDRQPWTEEQKQKLIQNYGQVSQKEIEKIIGRDINSIYAMAHKLKLTKTVVHDQWTPEQIEKLKEIYPLYPADQVAKMIGKSRSKIYSKAHELKISRYPKK